MVQVDLITGFLGAGKTTFLRRYVRYLVAQGHNVCILENDFGAVNVDAMLSAMNERIEALLDREHQLGHAYFMPLRDDPTLECLAQIFRQRVVPLLQEYFFDDWERIALVLNDHRKRKVGREELCFVVEHGRSLQALFGDGLQLPQGRKRWRINSEAFEDVASFAEIESFGEKSAMSGATDVVA